MTSTWSDFGLPKDYDHSEPIGAEGYVQVKLVAPTVIYIEVCDEDLEVNTLTLKLSGPSFVVNEFDHFFTPEEVQILSGPVRDIKSQLGIFVENMVRRVQTEHNSNVSNRPTVGSAWNAAGVEDERVSKSYKEERKGQH